MEWASKTVHKRSDAETNDVFSSWVYSQTRLSSGAALKQKPNKTR